MQTESVNQAKSPDILLVQWSPVSEVKDTLFRAELRITISRDRAAESAGKKDKLQKKR